MRLFINPRYSGQDNGDGGIRRVVEAQQRHLPAYGFDIVDDYKAADIVAVHAGTWLPFDGPIVEHCHGLYWKEYEWDNWCHKMNLEVIESLHGANACTAPTEWVANVLRRGMWLNPVVIPHGVDVEDWKHDYDHEEYVLWNKTRVDPICDVTPLDELVKFDPSHQYVSTYGTVDSSNLQIVGRVPFAESKRLVQKAGVYLATTRETFGIGTIEAMACGVPIVGWAWGGQRDIVEHKRTGWLCKPGDIEGLREGVEYCLANRARMSRACKKAIARSYTWEEVMKQYASLYYSTHADYYAERPTVSVIVTNYKLEHYLDDCINSIARACEGMDRGQVQIVLVNDASPTWTDGHYLHLSKLISDYGFRPFRYIENEQNLYLAGALNVGIKASSGKYIVPLDADNMLGPGSLAVLSQALDKDKSIDIAYGAMEVIESSYWTGISDWPFQEFSFREQISHRNQIPSTNMFRREMWERVGGYRRRCRMAEDADMWCRATSLGFTPKKVTDAVTLLYRDRNDSMSHVQPEWDWTAWYSWSRIPELTPFGAVQNRRPNVPSYEPVQISVVIPVGPNHRELVIDAIDSLVAQTFLEWECIVVNDSGAPLDWIHPFVQVVDTYQDEAINRVSHARNAGVKASKARLFVLLDADDYLQPNALEEMYRAYTTGTYVYTDWYVSETMEAYETPEYVPESVLQRLHHAVTCLYEKEAWEKVGGLDENLRGWEDWDFIIALNAAGYCGRRVPKPLLYYRLFAGARREELFANKEELVLEMYNKWHEYIDGEKVLMACGSCGGGRGSLAAPPNAMQLGYSPDPTGETVLVEYIGEMVGPLTYRGQSTGQNYRFGQDPELKIKYVYAQDVDGLLRFTDTFQLFTSMIPNEPILAAAGPPQQ